MSWQHVEWGQGRTRGPLRVEVLTFRGEWIAVTRACEMTKAVAGASALTGPPSEPASSFPVDSIRLTPTFWEWRYGLEMVLW